MKPRVFWLPEGLKPRGRRPGCNLDKNIPTLHPSMSDIAWAAGIYEGEGSTTAKEVIKNGKRYRTTPAVMITQKDDWMVRRMRELFGGTVNQYLSSNKAMGDKKYFRWAVHGPRARGFMYTIYSYLSPRRQEQLRVALGVRRVEE